MIRLEKFDKDSYANLISWVNSEEELMQFARPAFNFPLTNEQLVVSLNDKNRFAFKVVDSKTNISIGHSEIYLTTQSAYLGRILIADKKQRGKGLGQQIVNLLLSFAFTKLDSVKVELNVFDWNIQAIKCYEKVGFAINPEKKNERQIKNETWTAINMVIDKSKWQQLQLDKKTNA
jgi:RimJ/RimL family protein N-acetyltransferase